MNAGAHVTFVDAKRVSVDPVVAGAIRSAVADIFGDGPSNAADILFLADALEGLARHVRVMSARRHRR